MFSGLPPEICVQILSQIPFNHLSLLRTTCRFWNLAAMDRAWRIARSCSLTIKTSGNPIDIPRAKRTFSDHDYQHMPLQQQQDSLVPTEQRRVTWRVTKERPFIYRD